MVVPTNGPVPALSVTVTLTGAARPKVVGLPKRSTVLSTGCWPKGTLVTANPGRVVQAKLNTVPALTVTVALVEPKPVEANVKIALPVLVRLKPENVAMPLTALMEVVPCTFPIEAVTVTVALVGLALPKTSWNLITGWLAKATPATAVAEGAVPITNFVAALPATVMLEELTAV